MAGEGTAPSATEAKQYHEEIKGLVTDVRRTFEEMKAEREKHGKASADLVEKFEKQNARMDELDARLEEFRLSQRGGGRDGAKGDREAFDTFLRKGTTPEGAERRSAIVGTAETKALDLATPAGAGVLQDDDYLAEIQKTVVEFSPVRRFARVINISTTAIDIPRRTQTAAAAWIGETATRNETQNPNYELVNIPAYELYARADVSVQLLEDAEFDIEGELAMEFGEQFGVAEGTAFVSGAGSSSPLGFLDDTDGIDSVAMNESTQDTLEVQDLFDLFYGIKSPYAQRGVWMLNRATLPLIRAFESGTGGYLWSPGIAAGDPPNILGKPYAEATDMDAPLATGLFGASVKPIAFGDWRRAYTIVDRVAVQVQRDPYTLADTGQVRFIARKRVGGKPMIQEAAAYLLSDAS